MLDRRVRYKRRSRDSSSIKVNEVAGLDSDIANSSNRFSCHFMYSKAAFDPNLSISLSFSTSISMMMMFLRFVVAKTSVC